MRWLKRSLLFWALTLPLFYLFLLPWLLTKLEAKARNDSFASCQTHLTEEHLAHVPTAVLTDADAATYCHCVSDIITITRADLVELAQKKQPARLTSAMKPVVDACNATLQAGMNARINTGAQPRSTFGPDGTETVHFN